VSTRDRPARRDLVGYVELIDRFVCREIDAGLFEAEYLRMVKDDEVMHGDPAFGVIDELFFHVDEYFVPADASADERARAEEALRARARAAGERLRAL
jgi:hypothetical protein